MKYVCYTFSLLTLVVCLDAVPSLATVNTVTISKQGNSCQEEINYVLRFQ